MVFMNIFKNTIAETRFMAYLADINKYQHIPKIEFFFQFHDYWQRNKQFCD